MSALASEHRTHVGKASETSESALKAAAAFGLHISTHFVVIVVIS